MRKFVITVNGKSYEVEVEEVGQGTSNPVTVSAPSAPTTVPAAATAAPQPAPQKSETSKPATGGAVPQDAETIKAPMPGTILDVKVKVGDKILKGHVIAILEAMKMENEIMSPRDGEVVSVQVATGASVNPGDVIIAIK